MCTLTPPGTGVWGCKFAASAAMVKDFLHPHKEALYDPQAMEVGGAIV